MRYKSVELRFYGSLVDLLPGGNRLVERTFDVAPSIKDTIEACGVPHPEVDLVLADGKAVGWEHLLHDGERYAVYPRFRVLDVSGVSRVHVAPLPVPRFLADEHLGKLARFLRLLGFDTSQPAGRSDAELADLAVAERRALLTRDRELLKRAIVEHGYFVRSIDPIEQCIEVVRHFEIGSAVEPYCRCLSCNGVIGAVSAEEAADRVPASVAARYRDFRRCLRCGRTYWAGTHVARLDEVVRLVQTAVL